VSPRKESFLFENFSRAMKYSSLLAGKAGYVWMGAIQIKNGESAYAWRNDFK
jgi:hypothetical protein